MFNKKDAIRSTTQLLKRTALHWKRKQSLKMYILGEELLVHVLVEDELSDHVGVIMFQFEGGKETVVLSGKGEPGSFF